MHVTVTIDVEDCQAKCEQDNDCKAVSYHQYDRQCVLQNITLSGNAVSLQENKNGIYLVKLNDTCSK